MQQHSYPSHSIHFVLPGSLPAGLMIEEALEEGRTKLTGVPAALVEEHIFRTGEAWVVTLGVVDVADWVGRLCIGS